MVVKRAGVRKQCLAVVAPNAAITWPQTSIAKFDSRPLPAALVNGDVRLSKDLRSNVMILDANIHLTKRVKINNLYIRVFAASLGDLRRIAVLKASYYKHKSRIPKLNAIFLIGMIGVHRVLEIFSIICQLRDSFFYIVNKSPSRPPSFGYA